LQRLRKPWTAKPFANLRLFELFIICLSEAVKQTRVFSPQKFSTQTPTMSGEDAPAQQQNAEEQKQPQQEETKTPAESPKTESKPDPPPTSASTEAAAAAAAADTPAPAAEKAPEEDTFSYRALVLTGYGGYDKVKLQVKKGKPVLKSGEVMVRVKMCGLNFADLMARQGLYDRLPSPPVSPGMECSGIIEAVGEDVTDRKVEQTHFIL